MENQDKNIRENILSEIELSDLSFKRKMKMLQLLDTAFRQSLGAFYLSNQEVSENDILNRSM